MTSPEMNFIHSMLQSAQPLLAPHIFRPAIEMLTVELLDWTSELSPDLAADSDDDLSEQDFNLCIDVLASCSSVVAAHLFHVSASTFLETEGHFVNVLANWLAAFQSRDIFSTFRRAVSSCECDIRPGTLGSKFHRQKNRKEHMAGPIHDAEGRFEAFTTCIFAMVHQLSNKISVSKSLKVTEELRESADAGTGAQLVTNRRAVDGTFFLSQFLYDRFRIIWFRMMLVWLTENRTQSANILMCLNIALTRYQDKHSTPSLVCAISSFSDLPRLLIDDTLDRLYRLRSTGVNDPAAHQPFSHLFNEAGTSSNKVPPGSYQSMEGLAMLAKTITVNFDSDRWLPGFANPDANHIFTVVHDAVVSERSQPSSSSSEPGPSNTLRWLAAAAIHLYPAVQGIHNAEEMLEALKQPDVALDTLHGPCSDLWQRLKMLIDRARQCYNLGCPNRSVAPDLSCCTRCGVYRYCSKECLAQDWRDETRPHRKVCKQLKVLRAVWPLKKTELELEPNELVRTFRIYPAGDTWDAPSEQGLLADAERAGITASDLEEILKVVRAAPFPA